MEETPVVVANLNN